MQKYNIEMLLTLNIFKDLGSDMRVIKWMFGWKKRKKKEKIKKRE